MTIFSRILLVDVIKAIGRKLFMLSSNAPMLPSISTNIFNRVFSSATGSEARQTLELGGDEARRILNGAIAGQEISHSISAHILSLILECGNFNAILNSTRM